MSTLDSVLVKICLEAMCALPNFHVQRLSVVIGQYILYSTVLSKRHESIEHLQRRLQQIGNTHTHKHKNRI